MNAIIENDLCEITSKEYIDYTKLKDSTVLVTGATGMLASYVILSLLHLNKTKCLNITVIGLARSDDKAMARFGEFISSGELRMIYGDVCHEFECAEKLDYVLHLAGGASPRAITQNPTGVIAANTIGLTNVLERARRDSAKVLFASTREVYGEMPKEKVEIKEGDMGVLDTMTPRNCYPLSKRLGENLLVAYNKEYGVPFTIVRIAHSYGPMMAVKDDGRVLSDFIGCALRGEDITLYSSGEALRAFCYISDAISGIFTALLMGGDNEVYNLANESEEISVLGLAKTIVRVSESDISVRHITPTEQVLSGYTNFARVRLSTQKLESFGWRAIVSLEQGLQRTLSGV